MNPNTHLQALIDDINKATAEFEAETGSLVNDLRSGVSEQNKGLAALDKSIDDFSTKHASELERLSLDAAAIDAEMRP